MSDPEECRVFVGGLSWDTDERRLEQAFRRFGKVLEAKVMVDKGTGRPRGFGFVLFSDEQSVEDAIAGLHNGELDGRIISVSKAQPKLTGGRDFGYDASYDNADGRSGYSRGGAGGGVDGRSAGSDNCFRCGRPGHWARECPQGGDNGRSYGGGDGGRFPPKYSGSGYSRGGRGGRGDRFGGQDRFGSGPPMSGSGYGGDDRYGGRRDNSGSARYGDNSYGSRGGRGGRGGFDRGSDCYGSGGPSRVDRGYRDRPTPYGGRSGGRSNYDNHY